jgi:vacuolar-type H+-ATPase subunit H
MSLEALDTIALAEEKARQIRAAATTEASKTLREAQEAVTVMVAAAEGKADAEIKELTRKADEKAKEDAETLASNTRNREAAMQAHADRKMDGVVGMIVERIVNG